MKEPVRFLTRIVFAGLATMIVLENLGISLTAVWTTLGVGSVAIALALQDTLSSLPAFTFAWTDRFVRAITLSWKAARKASWCNWVGGPHASEPYPTTSLWCRMRSLRPHYVRTLSGLLRLSRIFPS